MPTHRNPKKSPYPKNFAAENFSTSFPKSRRCIFFRVRLGRRCFFSNPRMVRSYIGELEKSLGRWGGVRGRSAKRSRAKKDLPLCAWACARMHAWSIYVHICVCIFPQASRFMGISHQSFAALFISCIRYSYYCGINKQRE